MANKSNYKIGVQVSANGSNFNSEMDKAESKVKKFGSTLKNAVSSFAGNVASNAFSNLASYTKDAALELVRYESEIESTSLAFKNLSGDAAFAAKHIKELQQFSIANSLPFESLLTMSQRLQAGGVAGEKVIEVLKDVGNVAAATGKLSIERLEGISTALSQIISKGRLSAEEMEQLAERGVPAWKMLSEATGLSIEKLRKLSEQGVLTADDMLSALHKISTEKFGNAMAEQSKIGSGALIGLENAIKVSAAQAFEPLYKEFSQIVVKANEEVQKQGGDLEAVGEVIVKYIGIGAGKAIETLGEFLGKQLAMEVSYFFGNSIEEGILSKTFGALERGFDEGFWKPILGDEWFEKEWGKTVKKPIIDTNTALKDTVKTAKTLPDASRILNAQKAAEEAKALKKQYEFLMDTIKDLSIQALFFGDDSQAASTKSKLLAEGISNFDSGLAKVALTWAQYIDKLKDAKKAQDEYNDKLKTAKDKLADIKNEADFKVRFADPTDLDKFNEDVRRGIYNFRELKGEIELTRESLKHLLFNEDVAKRTNVIADFRKNIAATINELRGAKPDVSLSRLIADSVKDFGLEKAVDSRGVASGTTAERFGERVAGLMADWRQALDDATGDIEAQDQATKTYWDALENYFSGFYRIGGEGDTPKRIFPFSDKIDGKDYQEFTEAFIKLGTAAKEYKAAKLDQELDNLGIIVGGSLKSDLEKLNELLGDPAQTEAIEYRAKAVGMTAEAYKQMILAQKLGVDFKSNQLGAKGAVDYSKGGVSVKDSAKEAATSFFDGIGVEKFTSDAEMMKATMQELGQIGADSFNQLAAAMGSVVENWVLYGEMSGQNAKKAIASALAAASAQSAVSAIMETAYGIAALTPWGALLYGPAAFHFKSAALFATIAAGTALAGRAVAGDSFKGEKGGNADSPDYQTVNSANVQSTNQNVLVNSPGSARQSDVNSLAESINNLNQKITGMRPGDVVATGVKSNPGLIGSQALKDLKSNTTLKVETGKALGMS